MKKKFMEPSIKVITLDNLAILSGSDEEGYSIQAYGMDEGDGEAS